MAPVLTGQTDSELEDGSIHGYFKYTECTERTLSLNALRNNISEIQGNQYKTEHDIFNREWNQDCKFNKQYKKFFFFRQ